MGLRVAICGDDPRELWLHLRAYGACGAAEAACVLCGNGVAGRCAAGFDLRVPGGFEEVLSDKTIDAVEILASSPDRTERALEALEAGKHVLLAPPFGEDPGSAKRIALAANKSRGLLMPAENWKFFPPVLKLAGLVRKKTVGRITAIRMRTVLAGAGGWDQYLNPAFRCDAPEAGFDYQKWLQGELFEKLSLACEYLGPVKEIFCIDGSPGGGRSTVVTWQHAGHALYGAADLSYAPAMNIRSAYYPRDDNFELTGPSGIIWLSLGCSRMRSEPTLRFYRGDKQFAYGNLDDDWLRGFENTLIHFTDCALGKVQPDFNPDDAARVMEYTAAALESAASGKRIK